MNILLTYTDGLTIVHTIYKTASKTFAGEIAGYSTQGHPEQTPDSKPPPPAPTSTSSEEKPKAVSSQESTSSSEKSSSTLPTAIARPDHSSSIATSLAKATGDPSTPIGGFPGSQTSTPSATSNPDGDASSGPSAGAKAGIAIGVLGGVLLLGLIGFFIFRRKRAQKDSENGMHEKLGSGHDAFSTTPVIAPRVSLRPVTQFLPNWNERRTSKGAMMAGAGAAALAAAYDRPSTASSSNPANPFGNQAERVPSPTFDKILPSTPNGAPATSPFDDPLTASAPIVAGGPAAAAAAAGLTRKTSIRKAGQQANDFTLPPTLGAIPPSPVGTEFSVSSLPAGVSPGPSQSAAAIAAAGGPPSSAVHRVQLDFKPTLDDEMELRAGDLVRLLHEYDDGWALCIRLDRTQQGVVPRTCLSTRPVKPRPPPGAARSGPPINPQGGYPRGPGPQGRPMTPQGMRNGPGPRPNSPGPRPMSPAGYQQGGPGQRSQGPPGAPRPQSPSQMARRITPPGPSKMNPSSPPAQSPPLGRKPVPGQAM